LVAARNYLRGDDIVLEPRKLWPSGVGRKGKIQGLGEGRAVAFADDPGWAEELLALQRTGYGTVPDELLDGAVQVLRRWSKVWARPVAVVAAPAFSVEQHANRTLAQHLATVGKLPFLDVLSWHGEAQPTDSSSAPMVRHLEQVVHLDGALDVPAGPILLCATTMRTGWSLTVAAALLHEATGAQVLPLVVHRLP
jgi:ATP-dependent DNA helicase RecQ